MDNATKLITTVIVSSAMVGGAILQVSTPVEIPLTPQKVYLMGEILQDRVPVYDLSKYNLEEISKDYIDAQVMVGDNIAEAVNFCRDHKGEANCSLYIRIRDKLLAK